jgi:HAD superfamily hydrolase (TIGR01509 family)
MSPEAVAGLGFDLDHTLLVDNQLERVALLRLLEMIADDGGAVTGTLAEETRRIETLLEEQRGGAFSIEAAVRRWVACHGVARTDAYVECFRTMALDMVDDFVIPFPGAKRTFAELRKRGYKMAVLSNGWNPLQIRKAQRAGFDGPVLASADIGEQKPCVRAFEALLDALGTRPEQTWYVGDDPRGDVHGARNAGMHGIWIDAEERPFPPELPPPEYTIRALDALLDILPAPVTAGGSDA